MLQQAFYQLQQDRGEKIHQFAGQLEQKLCRLKANLPDHYESKQLKDRLFHGMSQHLLDSVRFLYKQESTGPLMTSFHVLLLGRLRPRSLKGKGLLPSPKQQP